MDENCIFCKLANGVFPTAKVLEDDKVTVILDAGPASRGHALVLPKEHYKDVTEAPKELLGHMLATAAKIGAAQKKALGAAGFNVVINTGEAAGQTVFHLHVHVIPRYEGEPVICGWVPGKIEDGEELAKEIAAAL